MNVFDALRLDGRRALITGGSRGLGLEMARALAMAVAELVIASRDEEHLQTARQELLAAGSPRVDVRVADLEYASRRHPVLRVPS